MMQKQVCITGQNPFIFREDENVIQVEGINFRKDVNIVGLWEIFGRRDYDFGGYDRSDYVFIDVGANVGDSTLFAANQSYISKVYGYEPFAGTYNIALGNIALNPNLEKKIEIFNYGWSNNDEEVVVNQVDDINANAVNSVETFFIDNIQRNRTIKTTISLKKASVVLKKIKHAHQKQPIILKLDIEGSEYKCFENLQQFGLLKSIDVIFVEWHIKGPEIITKLLDKNNFIWFNEYFAPNLGLIRAYRKI